MTVCDPDTDCLIWMGVTHNGTPRYSSASVRRLLVNVPKDMIATTRTTCKPLCVNREHIIITPRGGGGMLTDHGVRPDAYEELPNGCHRWLGDMADGRPMAMFHCRHVLVRRELWRQGGGDPREQLGSHCSKGRTDCVNPKHIVLREKVRNATAAHERVVAVARDEAMHAPPWERRNLRYVHDDIKAMMTEDAYAELPARLTPAWEDALDWLSGGSMRAMAKHHGLSHQGIYERITTLDQWLRQRR